MTHETGLMVLRAVLETCGASSLSDFRILARQVSPVSMTGKMVFPAIRRAGCACCLLGAGRDPASQDVVSPARRWTNRIVRYPFSTDAVRVAHRILRTHVTVFAPRSNKASNEETAAQYDRQR